jgi:hypothetical protein|tara:strand:- start:324 stop:515 length:192 start_codon:yes stop_codon:yes gene_type:complete
MKIGDLIKLKPQEHPRFGREFGTVVMFDSTVTLVGLEEFTEVLWDTGSIGWILSSRVEVVNGT